MFVRMGKEDFYVIMRDIGSMIEWSSITFLVPLIFSLIYMEPVEIFIKFITVAIFAFALGFILKKLFATEKETDLRHAFLAVSVLWLLYTAIAALPFVLIHQVSFLDAFFEAMSAITTTGLTILPNLDSMAKSLLFWRSLLSWIGGIGIVVLAMIGILATYSKAAKFISAEGREERLRPSLKNTAKEIWLVYLLLTVVGVFLLYFSGMNFFDSMNYAMSAISTTGMDLSTAGLVGLHNYWIDLSLIIIMILGATSFYTHYMFIRKKQFSAYFEDKEFQILMVLFFASAILILPKLVVFYQSDLEGLEQAFFTAASALTCGGFALEKGLIISQWADFVKLVLVAVMFIGGAAGSTAGGIKISRFWIFIKSIYWKMKASILPEKAFFARKFEGRDIQNIEIREIYQFILLYFLFILAGILVLTGQGHSLSDSLFEVVSAQSNAGITSGITHYGMNSASEIMLIFNMWVGRLEIIPILSLLGFAISLKPKIRKITAT